MKGPSTFFNAGHKKPAVRYQYLKSKGTADGVKSVMKNLDKHI